MAVADFAAVMAQGRIESVGEPADVAEAVSSIVLPTVEKARAAAAAAKRPA
jgi:hypothetical protein